MNELCNSEDFKDTLRVCLLAGLMRGVQDRWILTGDFEVARKEKIVCPNLLNLFDYEESILENMRSQLAYTSSAALEYYISHIMYLSRRGRYIDG